MLSNINLICYGETKLYELSLNFFCFFLFPCLCASQLGALGPPRGNGFLVLGPASLFLEPQEGYWGSPTEVGLPSGGYWY